MHVVNIRKRPVFYKSRKPLPSVCYNAMLFTYKYVTLFKCYVDNKNSDSI
jgi:hypothetical protein